MPSKYDLLQQIKDEVVALQEGELAKLRRQTKMLPVIGEGSHDAKVMLVGEAPGKNEAATGRPFCGAAGRVLTELIESIGLDRQNVYITNIVKDRPPDNRDPLPEEIAIYAPLLDRQINVIKPSVIATLGRFSMTYLMNAFGLGLELKNISQIHGKVFEAKAPYGKVKIITLYHPAVALYNGSMKSHMLQDFQTVKTLVN